jgi:hypothetical protein
MYASTRVALPSFLQQRLALIERWLKQVATATAGLNFDHQYLSAQLREGQMQSFDKLHGNEELNN